MLEQTWLADPDETMDVIVEDISTTQPLADPLLYARRGAVNDASRPFHSSSEWGNRLVHRSELEIGGRTWRFSYAPTADWLLAQKDSSSWFIFAGGSISSLLLAGLVRSSSRRAELVTRLVRKRTSELRESRRHLDNLLLQMPGMAYRFDFQAALKPLFISRGSVEIVGHAPDELITGGVNYRDLVHAEDRPSYEQAVAAALSQKRAYECEYRLCAQAGDIKWVLDRGQGIYAPDGQLLFIEGLAIDITQRKQAEAEKLVADQKLLEAQKLESLGVLAGGIAHDFNNLLTTIIGNTGILRLNFVGQAQPLRHLQQIEGGAQRAAELCQQMLAYAGKGQLLMQQTSLEVLVRETLPLIQHSLSTQAVVSFHCAAAVPQVKVDPTQIRQIVMNLVVNASDALDGNPGAITIDLATLERDDPSFGEARSELGYDPVDFVLLRVRDTGCGMSEETIARIFEPFFTTKFTGRGLGLAAVKGMVRSHHGCLLVTSRLGQGSAFTLVLPAVTSGFFANQPEKRAADACSRFAGTVLVIDDEEVIRGMAAPMFSPLGLTTLTAADGVEGVELFAAQPADIVLVLLDLTMPRMNGEEALRALRVVAPQLPVILMSGYNETALMTVLRDDRLGFLQKPFTLEALHLQVAKLLK